MAPTLAAPHVLTAIRSVLAADSGLVALLATAPAWVGGGPAIYSEGDVPANAPFDYLTLGPVTERPSDTMGRADDLKFGSLLTVQLKAICQAQNLDSGYAILARLMARLHVQTLTVSGYGHAESELDIVVDAYQEQIAGKTVKHFPSLWNVTVHQQS